MKYEQMGGIHEKLLIIKAVNLDPSARTAVVL